MLYYKIIAFALLLVSSSFANEDMIEIEQREFKLKNFPCMSCHEADKSKLPTTFPLLTPHERIEFKHHDNIKNCYSCHDSSNLDKLVLHTKEKISFNESYRLCFQCHGEKKRDWELGTHGKMKGSWNGRKYKYNCTNCHNPHKPPFRQMKADPGPVHPRGKKGQGAH